MRFGKTHSGRGFKANSCMLIWFFYAARPVVLKKDQVGISTNEIDAILHNFIISNKAYPSPLKYAGFPKSCCTSVNNVVVHGIPEESVLVSSIFIIMN